MNVEFDFDIGESVRILYADDKRARSLEGLIGIVEGLRIDKAGTQYMFVSYMDSMQRCISAWYKTGAITKAEVRPPSVDLGVSPHVEQGLRETFGRCPTCDVLTRIVSYTADGRTSSTLCARLRCGCRTTNKAWIVGMRLLDQIQCERHRTGA